MRTTQLLALTPLAVCAGLAVSPARAGGLTSAQVIKRCGQAYGALRTYRVNVSVTTATGRQTYHTSAGISFARPGRIRADGATMMGGRFAYVSSGRAAYQNSGGSWRKADSAEMAIAGATGIAMNAATTVPALLLHTRWGYPFSRAQTLRPAASESVDGHPCYRVSATGGAGDATYWVDKKTFLLRRYVYSSSAFHLRRDERYRGERINAPIPAATFSPPPGV